MIYTIVKLQNDCSIKIPEDVVQRLKLKRGAELFMAESRGSIVLMTKDEKNLWDGFRESVEEVREIVKRGEGVTDAEIDKAIKKVRSIKNRSRH